MEILDSVSLHEAYPESGLEIYVYSSTYLLASSVPTSCVVDKIFLVRFLVLDQESDSLVLHTLPNAG